MQTVGVLMAGLLVLVGLLFLTICGCSTIGFQEKTAAETDTGERLPVGPLSGPDPLQPQVSAPKTDGAEEKESSEPLELTSYTPPSKQISGFPMIAPELPAEVEAAAIVEEAAPHPPQTDSGLRRRQELESQRIARAELLREFPEGVSAHLPSADPDPASLDVSTSPENPKPASANSMPVREIAASEKPIPAEDAVFGSDPQSAVTDAEWRELKKLFDGSATLESLYGSASKADAEPRAVETSPVRERGEPPAATPSPASKIEMAPKEAVSAAAEPGSRDPESQGDITEEGRQVYARPGDDIEISFEGKGWVFLGYEEGNRQNLLSFQHKYYEENATVFLFRAAALGSEKLDFQYQDNSLGVQKNITLRVMVLEDEEFEEKLAAAVPPPDPADYTAAESLAAAGQYEEALEGFLSDYRSGSPYLNDRIAGLYWEMGSYGEALQYWAKNRDAEDGYSDHAVSGIVRSSLELRDYGSLVRNLDLQQDLASMADERLMLDLAWFLFESHDFLNSRDLVDTFFAQHPESPYADEALFLWGRIHEEKSLLRDFARAKEAYTEIYRLFPESEYSEEAYEKIRFLDRHFFDIR